MKKPSHRILLITVLVLSSICSYIYLRQVSNDVPAATQNEQVIGFEDKELDQGEILLPSVVLIKKVLELGRHFIQ